MRKTITIEKPWYIPFPVALVQHKIDNFLALWLDRMGLEEKSFITGVDVNVKKLLS